jgi:predicted secreted protein
MGIVSGIVVFFLTWWMVLFTVLPWGLKRDERGVPVNFHFKKKFFITTGISIAVWFVIFGLIEADLISFRSIADVMTQKDYVE